jgi:hypothetical protein
MTLPTNLQQQHLYLHRHYQDLHLHRHHLPVPCSSQFVDVLVPDIPCADDRTVQAIMRLNRVGRWYLIKDGYSISKGINVLSAVTYEIDCVFLHLLENPGLCNRRAAETTKCFMAVIPGVSRCQWESTASEIDPRGFTGIGSARRGVRVRGLPAEAGGPPLNLATAVTNRRTQSP